MGVNVWPGSTFPLALAWGKMGRLRSLVCTRFSCLPTSISFIIDAQSGRFRGVFLYFSSLTATCSGTSRSWIFSNPAGRKAWNVKCINTAHLDEDSDNTKKEDLLWTAGAGGGGGGGGGGGAMADGGGGGGGIIRRSLVESIALFSCRDTLRQGGTTGSVLAGCCGWPTPLPVFRLLPGRDSDKLAVDVGICPIQTRKQNEKFSFFSFKKKLWHFLPYVFHDNKSHQLGIGRNFYERLPGKIVFCPVYPFSFCTTGGKFVEAKMVWPNNVSKW